MITLRISSIEIVCCRVVMFFVTHKSIRKATGWILRFILTCWCVFWGVVNGFCAIASFSTAKNPSYFSNWFLISAALFAAGFWTLRFVIHIFFAKEDSNVKEVR